MSSVFWLHAGVLGIQQWHMKWPLPQATVAISSRLSLLTSFGSCFNQERGISSKSLLRCLRELVLLGGDKWVPTCGSRGWFLACVPTSDLLPPEGSDSSFSPQVCSRLGLFCRQRVSWVCTELPQPCSLTADHCPWMHPENSSCLFMEP